MSKPNKDMNFVLPPMVVWVSGMSAAGKGSISKELARKITNACFFERDSVMYGGLAYVKEGAATPYLPSFREYMGNDPAFPENHKMVDTPCGQFTLVYHDGYPKRPNFYFRHVEDQSYLIPARLAAENLQAGKVAIVVGFQMRQINGGILRKFMEQECFRGYPQYLIHVKVDVKECYRRFRDRCVGDPEAEIRFRPYATQENFDRLIMQAQQPEPIGLADFRVRNQLLVVDTTGKTSEESAGECLAFLQSRTAISAHSA